MHTQLIASGTHGDYVAMVAAERLDPRHWHIPVQLVVTLRKGPTEPAYQQAWNLVLREAYSQDRAGHFWELRQSEDGSVLAVQGD